MSYSRNDFGEKKRQGKKGFYLSICTALICLMAVGTVYYKTNHPSSDRNTQNELANESISVPQSTPAGNGAISENNQMADADQDLSKVEESKEVTASVKNETSENQNDKSEKTDKKKKNTSTDTKKQEKEDKKDSVSTMSNEAGAGQSSFNEEKGLLWPVKGDVIMKYSKSNNVYFKTLAQYKCNPAIEISAKEGSKVSASAAGTVTDISKSEETGTTVTTSIGNNYTVVYGQLKDVKVKKGQSIKEGDMIGKVASPTKYFTEEGSNLYFQVTQNNETVDPMLLLR